MTLSFPNPEPIPSLQYYTILDQNIFFELQNWQLCTQAEKGPSDVKSERFFTLFRLRQLSQRSLVHVFSLISSNLIEIYLGRRVLFWFIYTAWWVWHHLIIFCWDLLTYSYFRFCSIASVRSFIIRSEPPEPPPALNQEAKLSSRFIRLPMQQIQQC